LTALTQRSRIEVPRVDYEKLSGNKVSETSETIRARVQAARDIQGKRFGLRSLQTSEKQSRETLQSVVCNADMRIGEIRQFCKLQDEGQGLMRSAMTQLNLSARAYTCTCAASAGVIASLRQAQGKPEAGAHDCGFGWE